jgi:hypothetical protein
VAGDNDHRSGMYCLKKKKRPRIKARVLDIDGRGGKRCQETNVVIEEHPKKNSKPCGK